MVPGRMPAILLILGAVEITVSTCTDTHEDHTKHLSIEVNRYEIFIDIFNV